MSSSSEMVRRSVPAADKQSLMSPAELAAFLGGEFPEKTLANWRSQGSGPKFLKIGRHVRYRSADVEAWLSSREVEAGAA